MKDNILLQEAAFSFRRLTESYLDIAVTLCDNCVGENLYSRAQLTQIIYKPTHYFYLIFAHNGEAVGYIYFFLTDLGEMMSLSKLSDEQLNIMTMREHPVIGNLQSIGVAGAYRGQGVSEILVDFFLTKLHESTSADVAFGVFWKTQGIVPMEKTLKAFDFIYITDAQGVWQDKKDLICPFCRGRCTCEASVYYKPLEKGDCN